ncbi:hypothetical protein [Paenibacillus solani]|uniref:Uncharacterized protein n=1 Tax=Paenibacillus solani TaxID=1705565 RepID=A0A0M1P2C6_9BACL|nr:hypothetical protein [Paenibacillus solani]KOR88219.1 hypothetical protein AM231_03020 [Paenibacillus solani]
MGASYPKRFKLSFTNWDYLITGVAVVFFPLAIVLAAIRVLVTHRHNSCKGRNNRLFGWVLIITYGVIEFLMIIATIEDGDVEGLYSASFVFGIIILIPAIIMLLIARKEDKKFSGLLQFYINAITQKGLLRIDYIAQEARLTEEHAIRDITFMFEKRILPNGRIEDGMVIIPSMSRRTESPNQGEFVSRRGQQVQYSLGTESTLRDLADSAPKSVECPGCGARTVVAQVEGKECEYCGTVIVA